MVIDQTDRRLVEWVKSLLPTTPISIGPPVTNMPTGVNIYLFELGASPPPRGPERPPLQFSLHYLVTSWAQDDLDAHKVLGDLISAAMQETEFEVDFDVARINWGLFGLVPRPAFLLKLPARVPLPGPSAPLVRRPVVLHTETISRLVGRVLGPGDIPLVGAHVQIPSLDFTVHTDVEGRFVVPIGTRPLSLRVTAKGKSQTVTAEPQPDGTPITVRFDLAEV